ncbi:MAG: hypothetical protein IT285_15610, partial [Bdellovibrionales bacterium]|nr:hypothetical protein [Bdellovibrionales bacterium]
MTTQGNRIPWREYRSLIALLALMAVLAVLTEGTFLTARNLTNLSRQVAINGILAVGMTYVIILRGIDLSVGSVVALAGIAVGYTQVNLGWAQWAGGGQLLGAVLSTVAAIVVGLACGLFNAWWITRYRIAPFIITLGMMVIARGLALIFSDGAAIAPLGEAFNSFGQGYLSGATSVVLVAAVALPLLVTALRSVTAGLAARVVEISAIALMAGASVYACLDYRGMPIPVVVFGALGIGGILLLERTRLGRYVMAIGGNPDAAWLAG